MENKFLQFTFFLITLLLLNIFFSCQKIPERSSPSESSETGKNSTTVNPLNLFATNCSSCHSLQGGRISGQGGALTPSSLANLTEVQLKEIITKGQGQMPPFEKRLNQQELDALIKFLKY